MDKIKAFIGKHKVKIGVTVGVVVTALLGVWVGDVTMGQIKDCVMSFNTASDACKLIGFS